MTTTGSNERIIAKAFGSPTSGDWDELRWIWTTQFANGAYWVVKHRYGKQDESVELKGGNAQSLLQISQVTGVVLELPDDRPNSDGLSNESVRVPITTAPWARSPVTNLPWLSLLNSQPNVRLAMFCPIVQSEAYKSVVFARVRVEQTDGKFALKLFGGVGSERNPVTATLALIDGKPTQLQEVAAADDNAHIKELAKRRFFGLAAPLQVCGLAQPKNPNLEHNLSLSLLPGPKVNGATIVRLVFSRSIKQAIDRTEPTSGSFPRWWSFASGLNAAPDAHVRAHSTWTGEADAEATRWVITVDSPRSLASVLGDGWNRLIAAPLHTSARVAGGGESVTAVPWFNLNDTNTATPVWRSRFILRESKDVSLRAELIEDKHVEFYDKAEEIQFALSEPVISLRSFGLKGDERAPQMDAVFRGLAKNNQKFGNADDAVAPIARVELLAPAKDEQDTDALWDTALEEFGSSKVRPFQDVRPGRTMLGGFDLSFRQIQGTESGGPSFLRLGAVELELNPTMRTGGQTNGPQLPERPATAQAQLLWGATTGSLLPSWTDLRARGTNEFPSPARRVPIVALSIPLSVSGGRVAGYDGGLAGPAVFDESRESPIIIPVGDGAIKAPGYATFRESMSDTVTRRLDVSWERAPTVAKAGTRRVVIIDPEPFLVGMVMIPDPDLNDPSTNELGVWTSEGGGRWALRQGSAFEFRLPPQALGEAMVRGRDWLPGFPRHRLGEDRRLAESMPGDLSMGMPASFLLSSTRLQRDTSLPVWDARALFGRPGDEAPGALLRKADFELLYGLSTRLELPDIRVAELAALVGGLVSPSEDGGGTFDRMAATAQAWNARLRGWRAYWRAARTRLAILEPWMESQAGALVLRDEGLSFRLRVPTSRQADGSIIYDEHHARVRDPFDPKGNKAQRLMIPEGTKEKFPTIPGGAKEKCPTIPGGATWGFESQTVLTELYKAAGSDGGSVAGLGFSTLGGFGSQRAEFSGRKTAILSTTSMGRTSSYSIERIGRIGVLYHRAKHVIVYERTVAPSAQMYAANGGSEKTPLQTDLLGVPALRKVREYVEIMQPLREYPDLGGPPIDRAFVVGARFKSTVIPVDTAWGEDTDYGWRIPLWKRGLTGDLAVVYPKPQVVLSVLSSDQKGEVARDVEIDDPEKLCFYTTTVEGTTANTDQWPAVRGVDYPDTATPNIVEDSVAEASLETPLPDAPVHSADWRAFTYTLNAGDVATNLVAERVTSPVYAVMRNVTLARGQANDGLGEDVKNKLKSIESFRDGLREIDQCGKDAAQAARELIERFKSGGIEQAAVKQEIDAALTRLQENINTWKPQTLNVIGTRAEEWGKAAETGLKSAIERVSREVLERSERAEAAFKAALSWSPAEAITPDLREALSVAVREYVAFRPEKLAGALKERAMFGVAEILPVGLEPAAEMLARACDIVENEIKREVDKARSAVAVSLADLLRRAAETGVRGEELTAECRAVLLRASESLRDELEERRREVEEAVAVVHAAIGDRAAVVATLDALDRLCADEISALRAFLPRPKIEAWVEQLQGTSLDKLKEHQQNIRELELRGSSAAAELESELRKARAEIDRLSWTVDHFLSREKDPFVDAIANVDAALRNARNELSSRINATFKEVLTSIRRIEDDALSAREKILVIINDPKPRTPADLVSEVTSKVQEVAIALNADVQQLKTSAIGQIGPLITGTLFRWPDVSITAEIESLKSRASGIIEKLQQDLAKELGDPLITGPKVIERIERAAMMAERRCADAVSGLQSVAHRVGEASGADRIRLPHPSMKLLRAFGDAPIAPGLEFTRKRLEYIFDAAKQTVDLSPVTALLARGGDDLKALGISLPTRSLGSKFLPDKLPEFDVSKILPEIAGIKFAGLLKGLKFPSIASDNVAIAHGHDAQTGRPWAQASVHVPLPKCQLFEFGPIAISLERAVLDATSMISGNAEGQVTQVSKGSITADWIVTMGGLNIVAFVATPLEFGPDGLRFKPSIDRVRLPEVLEFISELLKSGVSKLAGGKGGLEPVILRENGIPVGIESVLSLALPKLTAGTTGITGLALSASFGVLVRMEGGRPDFTLRTGFALAGRQAPFNLSIFILGGAGHLEVRAAYSPLSGAVSAEIALGIYASASLSLNLGIASGSVAAYLGIELGFRASSNAPSALSISAALIIRGEVEICGFITVCIEVGLRFTYIAEGGNRRLRASGYMQISIEIGWFFSIDIEVGVSYEYTLEGGQSTETISRNAESHCAALE